MTLPSLLTLPTQSSNPASPLERRLFWRITPAHLLLAGLILLSAVLHFWKIGAIGDSNRYYTAAVESMTQSWHNFFFVSAEPGGSVTVDKPPLGLWVETLFALVLGVSGFSTSLPNILAGIFSVPLLYHLVRKHLGTGAGLVAALVMAVTPIVFGADRNNTSDGLLTFVLLLAAWAFLRAAESGKLRHLLLGAVIVGLGFNIKMMQALLPLPAFYALYFFASRNGWGRKLLHIGVATLLLAAVSLSWAVVVDLTPASERPYVGSSENNTVMDLIVGYNGMQRLLGNAWNRIQGGNADGAPDIVNQPPAPQGVAGADAPNSPYAAGYTPSYNANNGAGAAFSQETGEPGILRFFQAPLAKEMSWLLPFGLAGILLAFFARRMRLPLEHGIHKALVLWGGWLLTCLVFFSAAKFFHAYYMILLVPALGGATALAFASLKAIGETRPRLAALLLALLALATVVVQVLLAVQFIRPAWWLALPALLLAAGAVIVFVRGSKSPDRFRRIGTITLLLALAVIPLAWSILTVADVSDRSALPAAYSGDLRPQQNSRLPQQPNGALQPNSAPNIGTLPNRPGGALPPRPQNLQQPNAGNANLPAQPQNLQQPNAGDANLPAEPQNLQQPNVGDANVPAEPQNAQGGANLMGMLDLLQENTQGMKYLVAVPSAQVGAPLVIATGRPVLYMGGFSGGDPVIDGAGIAALVRQGDLRYVFFQQEARTQGNGVAAYLRANCTPVAGTGLPARNNAGTTPNNSGAMLFDCAAGR